MPATSGDTPYVWSRDDNWYVGESRVELYSVIAAWQQGYSPEEVREGFPHLSLREVYGAILFYLERQQEVETFFRQVDEAAGHDRQRREREDPAFYATMRERMARYRAARHQTAAS